MKTNKVVINSRYGGFSLSYKAAEKLAEMGVEAAEKFLTDKKARLKDFFRPYGFARHDPRLVKVVEELGKEADGQFSDLEVVEIEGNKYRINEYDGMESVETPDSTYWIEIEE